MLRLVALLPAGPAVAHGDQNVDRERPRVDAAWGQPGPDGSRLARAITAGSACPAARFDGEVVMLRERAAPGANFAVRCCEAPIPPEVRRVIVGEREIRVPARSPRRPK
jgi:hypothetical protein